MFCEKCGKELKDDSMFCDACGAPVVNTAPSASKPAKSGGKMVGIIIAIVAVVLILGGVAGYAAYTIISSNSQEEEVASDKKKSHKDKSDKKKSDEKEDDEDAELEELEEEEFAEAEAAEEEPEEIFSSNAPKYDVDELRAWELDYDYELALLDIANTVGYPNVSGFSFCTSAAKYTPMFKEFYNGGFGEYSHTMYEGDLEDLMYNTLGIVDFNDIDEDESNYVYRYDDQIFFTLADTGDYVDYTVCVDEEENLSGGRVLVSAHQDHENLSSIGLWGENFEVILKPNQDSPWMGMQIEEYDMISAYYYYLPYAHEMVYDLDDLLTYADWSEEDYRIARNEIFARHGRKFEKEIFRNYFENQPWYEGLYDDYPISSLNEYERKNIAVLDEYKKVKGYK